MAPRTTNCFLRSYQYPTNSFQRLPEYVPAKAPGVAIADMVDPALNGGIEFGEAYFAGAVSPPAFLQPSTEMMRLARLQKPMGGIDDKPQPGNAGVHGDDLCPGVNLQAHLCQSIDDGNLPAPQLLPAVAEKRKIVHMVAEVGRLLGGWLKAG